MLPIPVAGERVQTIAWRISQVFEAVRRVEHRQFGKSAILNIGRQLPAALTVPDAFGFLIGEAEDHLITPSANICCRGTLCDHIGTSGRVSFERSQVRFQCSAFQ